MYIMIRRLFVFVILMLFIAAFFYYALPELKEFKDNRDVIKPPEQDIYDGDGTITGKRAVTVDISVEDICKNFITGNQYEKCTTSTGCDSTCQTEGCSFFGLDYESSEFLQNKCKCNCLEENKIIKALNPID